jgi:RyR domain-containing protein
MGEGSNIERIARVCHEVNRAYCQSLGDISQATWENAPQWQRESAMTGVAAIITNPAITPEQSHEGWLEQKRADGWTYGPVKDAEKKEHPCFVPYEQLPMEQRAKDYLFGAVVRTLAFEVPELVTSR